MMWVGRVARMVDKRNAYRLLVRNPEEKTTRTRRTLLPFW
jgi:hypothetical protein